MNSDKFDVQVPDTIPDYVVRRHGRMARRAVARTHRVPTRRRVSRRLAVWGGVVAVLALIGAIVATWTLWPSPTTFVVIPTVVLVAAVFGVTYTVARKTGLDWL